MVLKGFYGSEAILMVVLCGFYNGFKGPVTSFDSAFLHGLSLGEVFKTEPLKRSLLKKQVVLEVPLMES